LTTKISQVQKTEDLPSDMTVILTEFWNSKAEIL